MSILFLEGFDSYADVDDTDITAIMAASGWAETDRVGWSSDDTRTGRGGYMTQQPASTVAPSVWYFPFPTRTEIICGFACWTSSFRIHDPIFAIGQDTVVNGVVTHIIIMQTANASLAVINADSDTVLAESEPNSFPSETWHYVEVKANTNGALTLKINGCVCIQTTGLDLLGDQGNGYNRAGGYSENYENGAQYPRLDDIYCLDTNGTDFNDFIGDVVIDDLLPTSDSGTNEMTTFGSGLSGHFDAVDEIPQDGDTTYLYTDTADIEEQFEVTDLASDVVDVLAVQVSAYAKRVGTDYRTFKVGAEVSATKEESDDFYTALNYTQHSHVFENVPGGVGWTPTQVNALKVSVRTIV